MSPKSTHVGFSDPTMSFTFQALNYSTDITHKKFEEKEEEITLTLIPLGNFDHLSPSGGGADLAPPSDLGN